MVVWGSRYDLLIFGWIEKPFIRCFFFSGFSGAMRNLLQLLCFFGGSTENLCQVLTAEKQRRMAVVESFFESGWTENQENRTPTVRNSSSKFLSNPKSTQESWKSSLGDRGDLYNGNDCKSTIFSARGLLYTLNQVLKVALLWQNGSRDFCSEVPKFQASRLQGTDTSFKTSVEDIHVWSNSAWIHGWLGRN